MNSLEPLVSVVVTTINRPHLVTRAVESALRQSLTEIEVIVVVDGPDRATEESLAGIDDRRLRVLALPENGGLGAARNNGIAQARGRWVALLDDDDEWLPRKLETQLDAAERSSYSHPIMSCRFIARTEYGDVTLPRRFPGWHEDMSEYLFCQTGLLGGEGVILPSTIFTRTDLARTIPFRHKRLPHEGSDWVLRAIQHKGVGVEFVGTRDPLAIWHAEKPRDRMSASADWRASLAWADENAGLFTPHARASFILIRTSLEAKRAGDWRACWLLFREAFRQGHPTRTAIVAHTLIWFAPRALRFRIAAHITRWFSFKEAADEADGARRTRPDPPALSPGGKSLP